MMDLTCFADSLPKAGETIFGKSFTTGFGGKGANQAVMAGRCGSNVFMIGNVGNDNFGELILENFRNSGVNASFSRVSNSPTGVAHIWVDSSGENRIIIIPGANNDFRESEVIVAISEIPNLKIVIAQCEIPQEITLAAFKAAHARGALTLLNPAPFQPLSDELLSLTDWLVVNEIEFSQLHPEHALPTSDAIIATLRPGKAVVVTLGSEGAALVDSTGNVYRVKAPRVVAVDSTGAGDCFIGAFASALVLNLEASKALNFATIAASRSVLRHGAQSSYPSHDEIVEILDRIGT